MYIFNFFIIINNGDYMKKILKFLLFLLPWFLSGLLMQNVAFYKTLNLPSFAPPTWVFPVAWSILYILIAISIYKISNIDFNKNYKKYLILNYLLNQSFTIFFFNFKSLTLGFISCILTLLTGYFLYDETKKIDKKTSYLLIPYLIWLIFASILSTFILFMN